MDCARREFGAAILLRETAGETRCCTRCDNARARHKQRQPHLTSGLKMFLRCFSSGQSVIDDERENDVASVRFSVGDIFPQITPHLP